VGRKVGDGHLGGGGGGGHIGLGLGAKERRIGSQTSFLQISILSG